LIFFEHFILPKSAKDELIKTISCSIFVDMYVELVRLGIPVISWNLNVELLDKI